MTTAYVGSLPPLWIMPPKCSFQDPLPLVNPLCLSPSLLFVLLEVTCTLAYVHHPFLLSSFSIVSFKLLQNPIAVTSLCLKVAHSTTLQGSVCGHQILLRVCLPMQQLYFPNLDHFQPSFYF
jgi:hypothetical protein